MKSKRMDASDNMLGWMRETARRLSSLERVGRTDLLEATIDGESSVLAVRTFAEIPEDLPLSGTAYVLDEQVEYRQDPVTRAWTATGS